MAINNPSTGGINDGDQEFTGHKSFDQIDIKNGPAQSGTEAMSSGTGTIKMANGNNANSSVWIPIYHEGKLFYVPGFTDYTP